MDDDTRQLICVAIVFIGGIILGVLIATTPADLAQRLQPGYAMLGRKPEPTLTIKMYQRVRSFDVRFEPTSALVNLRQRVYEREGLRPSRQKMYSKGHELTHSDGRNLADCGLQAGDVIYVFEYSGGCNGCVGCPPKTAVTK